MCLKNPKKNAVPLPKSIYFGGCSWGAAYYVGVHKAMVELWGSEFYKDCLITGGSAGTIIAVLIALGLSHKELDEVYRTLAGRAVIGGTIGRGTEYVEAVMRQVFRVYRDPHLKIQGRCLLGTTSFPCTHKWHDRWNDEDDLIETIKGSFHIPFYCTPFIHQVKFRPLPSRYRAQLFIDPWGRGR